MARRPPRHDFGIVPLLAGAPENAVQNMTAQDQFVYRHVIRVVAQEIWERPLRARVARFEAALAEWRRLNRP